MELNNFIQHCKKVIGDEEGADSRNCLIKLKNFLSANDIDRTNKKLSIELQNLVVQLKIIAFANISDLEAAEVLEKYYLQSFNMGISLENLLISKLFSVPYGARIELREELKQALLRNQQKIGTLVIREWIEKFDKFSSPKSRDESAIINFARSDNHAKNLNPREIEILKKILHTYDYLLVYTLPAIDKDLENLKSFYANNEGGLKESEILYPSFSYKQKQAFSSRKIQQIILKEALQKYPKLGEQGITSVPLKIKSFDRLVRPSIKNWIYDYTSQLGQSPHDSMQRTNFLFRSENAKNLSSTEREKLGIILKSFDENTPLPVDTENEEIVFENPIQSSAFPSREPISRDSSKPSFSPGQKPAAISQKKPNDFIKPYPSVSAPKPPVMAKPAMPPRPVDQGSTFLSRQQSSRDSSKSNFIQFVNPYPAPDTHKMATAEPEMAGESPVKMKGFSEGVSRDSQDSVFPTLPKVRPFPSGKQVAGIPQGQTLSSSKPNFSAPEPPKPYPSHPKNVVYPHYRPPKDEKPEPRIDGNVVDLSGNDQRSTNNEQ